MREDVYLKKVISLKHRGKTLQFRVSQDLFSSFQVDIGSRFLLRTVMPSGTHSFGKILDLGCGYGPLGLALKSGNNAVIVHMVDRDALAVEYSRRNAELNELSGIQVYGSLGYDDVCEKDFDIIVANIPGKAGEQVIAHFLKDARYFLKSGGLVAVVVVNAIASMVEQILDDAADIDIVFRQDRSGHTVYHYRFTSESDGADNSYIKAIERKVYQRNEASFQYNDVTWQMCTARGLPEFDSLHYRTRLLLDGLHEYGRENPGSVAVLNPGQGHVPVFLWRIFQPEHITLIDRDLLSLRYSQRNLALNDCPEERTTLLHRVGFAVDSGEKYPLIVAGILREEEGPAATALAVTSTTENLVQEGLLLVSASSTAVTRLVDSIKSKKHLEIVDRRKRRGYCLLVIKPG